MSRYLLVDLLFLMFCRVRSVCDTSTTAIVSEGNIGQSALFPWLGVLRVRLYEGENSGMAVTGIVLIKRRYALVNADDVTKIPQHILHEYTHVMFIPSTDEPWFSGVKSYVTHPEYGFSSQSTIAVIELDLGNIKNYPIRPICWPEKTVTISSHLYVAGYIDENQFLEKAIYKVQHIDKGACEEFYDRAGLGDTQRVPAHYSCVSSPSNRAQCVWDNGMVLVTNITKFFSLIGFSIRGPGCAAPARFIDLQQYYNWIEVATTDKNSMYHDEYRTIERRDNIPIHEMFNANSSLRRDIPSSLPMRNEVYPFAKEVQTLKHFNVIMEDDKETVLIMPFDEEAELYPNACKDILTLMYTELMELSSNTGTPGYAYYRISLFDLTSRPCGCVRLSVDGLWRSQAKIAVKEYTNVGDEDFTSLHDTPENLLKYVLMPDVLPTTPLEKRNKFMKPGFVVQSPTRVYTESYDLYIKFMFEETTQMKIEFFSANIPQEEQISGTRNAQRRLSLPILTSQEKRYQYMRRNNLKKKKNTRS